MINHRIYTQIQHAGMYNTRRKNPRRASTAVNDTAHASAREKTQDTRHSSRVHGTFPHFDSRDCVYGTLFSWNSSVFVYTRDENLSSLISYTHIYRSDNELYVYTYAQVETSVSLCRLRHKYAMHRSVQLGNRRYIGNSTRLYCSREYV